MSKEVEKLIIKVGFDGRAALAGIKSLDTALSGLEKKMAKIAGLQAKIGSAGGQGKGGTKMSRGEAAEARFRGTAGFIKLKKVNSDLAENLSRQMRSFADSQDYESMGQLRDQVRRENDAYKKALVDQQKDLKHGNKVEKEKQKIRDQINKREAKEELKDLKHRNRVEKERQRLAEQARKQRVAATRRRLKTTRRFSDSTMMTELSMRDRSAAAGFLGRFRKASRAGNGREITRIKQEVKELNKSLRAADKSSSKFFTNFNKGANIAARNSRSLGIALRGAGLIGAAGGPVGLGLALVAGTAIAGAAGYAMLAKGAFGVAQNNIIPEAAQMESLRGSMRIASGSERQAGRDMDYVIDQAQRLGSVLPVAAKGFMQISTATRDMLTEDETKRLFESTLEISTALGLSADDAEGALRAFVQMASKGKVTAEELKSQLGERLPGALQMAARAMGMTTEEIFKMMEDGRLMSQDFLPAMADEMARVAREGGALDAQMNSIRASQARLSTAFTLFMENASKAGVGDAFKDILETVTVFLEDEEAAKAFGRVITDFLIDINRFLEEILPKITELATQFNSLYDKKGEGGLGMLMGAGVNMATGNDIDANPIWSLIKAGATFSPAGFMYDEAREFAVNVFLDGEPVRETARAEVTRVVNNADPGA